MSSVGIIANPVAGKDIRRLVAYGSSIDNHEKVGIVRRILLGLDALGVERVWLMPDMFPISIRAFEDIKGHLRLQASILEMPLEGTAQDSELAASLMAERGVACIITLGGDGTNRAVAKGCGRVPLLAISTGTNNVFPRLMEGTTAGLAAGVAATDGSSTRDHVLPTRKLVLRRGGEVVDMALIDVVVTSDLFAGTKAVWEVSHIREIFSSRGSPTAIGLSSIIGCFQPLDPEGPEGLYLRLGEGGERVLAPIGPGLIRSIPICESRPLRMGEPVEVTQYPSMLALDGEREVYAGGDPRFTVELSPDGPLVLDPDRILQYAARKGLFKANG